ncbi:hypothetical protein C8R46DRAFT_1356330 [Mycena filopes]|nr:hypothetical protein C8R46DRAFT_1356330 [Mycena filopes]
MFVTASIAFASLLFLPHIAVRSAPVRRDTGTTPFHLDLPPFIPQACTGPTFAGDCTPINGTACTNAPGSAIVSLSVAEDASCTVFTQPNCQSPTPQKQFSDNSFDLSALGIQSVQCVEDKGTVNGLQAGSAESIAHQTADEQAADGFVPSPPANCTEGPVTASAEEQASAAANGVVLSGPVTCTF